MSKRVRLSDEDLNILIDLIDRAVAETQLNYAVIRTGKRRLYDLKTKLGY